MISMRRVLTTLAIGLVGLVMAIPAQAAGPPFQAGPKGGDQFTSASADPATGTVQVFQLNLRQSAAVACAGQGPFATLETSMPGGGVHSLSVAYTDGSWMDTVVLNVDVIGSKTGAIGHGAVTGQKMGASGQVNVPLFSAPAPGETLTTIFGLQVHNGCLPGFVVGIPGSRPAEGGRVTFTNVTAG
jgi:hypothetical protein